jgi:hypothetical protein
MITGGTVNPGETVDISAIRSLFTGQQQLFLPEKQ